MGVKVRLNTTASLAIDKILAHHVSAYMQTPRGQEHRKPYDTEESFRKCLPHSSLRKDLFQFAETLNADAEEVADEALELLEKYNVDTLIDNYRRIYTRVILEQTFTPWLDEKLRRWYVCGTGAANDPLVILECAIGVHGDTRYHKEDKSWEIWVPPQSPENIQVLPGPCAFFARNGNENSDARQWEVGGLDSRSRSDKRDGKRWTVDSNTIPDLKRHLNHTGNVSFMAVPLRVVDPKSDRPAGDFSTTIIRIVQQDTTEPLWVQIHYSLDLRMTLTEISREQRVIALQLLANGSRKPQQQPEPSHRRRTRTRTGVHTDSE